jgi:uncharacterized membrane protein
MEMVRFVDMAGASLREDPLSQTGPIRASVDAHASPYHLGDTDDATPLRLPSQSMRQRFGASLRLRTVTVAAWLCALALVLMGASVAEAQFTGGSVGGGSFSGGDPSSGGDGGDGGDLVALFELVSFLFRVHPALGIAGLVGVLAYLIIWSSRQEQTGHHGEGSVGSHVPSPTARAWFQVDITEVRVALDARARAFLQRELMEQGRRANTSTKKGLNDLLQVVVRALRSSEAAWTHAGAKNFHPMSSIQAEATFRRLASDARAKFTHELVRNDAGTVREGEGHGVRRSVEREGEGVVLITLIVAANREIVDFEATSRAEVGKVLDDLARLTPDTLVALELSWMPAAEDDLMSTATLEALHPDMKLLPGALGGRTFCAYCKGPFTKELKYCPHCGAPNDAAPAPAPP